MTMSVTKISMTPRIETSATSANDHVAREHFDKSLAQADSKLSSPATPARGKGPNDSAAANSARAKAADRRTDAQDASRTERPKPAAENEPGSPTDKAKPDAAADHTQDQTQAQADDSSSGDASNGKAANARNGDQKKSDDKTDPLAELAGDAVRISAATNAAAGVTSTAVAVEAGIKIPEKNATDQGIINTTQSAKTAALAQEETAQSVNAGPRTGEQKNTSEQSGEFAAGNSATSAKGTPTAKPAAPTFKLDAADANATPGNSAGNSQTNLINTQTNDRVGAASAKPDAAMLMAQVADADNVDGQANVDRVARGLQTALNQRGGTVSLRLQPPELGMVRIQMEVQDGSVRVRFTTETEGVRDLLSHQMGQLRESLERQGLSVDRLEVQTQQAAPTHGAGTGGFQDHRGAGDSAADGRSRGEYTGGGSSDQGQDRADQENGPGSFEQELVNTLA